MDKYEKCFDFPLLLRTTETDEMDSLPAVESDALTLANSMSYPSPISSVGCYSPFTSHSDSDDTEDISPFTSLSDDTEGICPVASDVSMSPQTESTEFSDFDLLMEIFDSDESHRLYLTDLEF